MGCCCQKGLLDVLDNKTQIYYKCPDHPLPYCKEILVSLDGNVYNIMPTKDQLVQTNDIHKRQDGLLTFLKDDQGIVTSQSHMQTSFFQILSQLANANYQRIIFRQPLVNYQNKQKLFQSLISSIIHFDKLKLQKKLKTIYIPWKDLTEDTMRNIITDKIGNMTVLVEDQT